MNVLIFSHVQLWPLHHAETIELALRHLNSGDTVFILSCTGGLSTCPANPAHSQNKCDSCRRQTEFTQHKFLKGCHHIDFAVKNTISVDISGLTTAEKLRQFTVDGVPVGALALSQLVSREKNSYVKIQKFKEELEDWISNGIELAKFTGNILREKNIDKVYSWNGRRISDGAVCFAAKKVDIPCEVYISGVAHGTYMTLGATNVQGLDAHKERIAEIRRQIQYDEIKNWEIEAEKFYQNQKLGNDQFPGFVHFASNFKKKSIKINKKCLVIYTSSFHEYFSIEEFSGGVYGDHYDGLRKILSEARLLDIYDVFVRWHPNLRNAGFEEKEIVDKIILDFSFEGITHFASNDEVDSYELCEAADVVVTFGSTMGVEAAYYGKASVIVGRAWYEDLGCMYKPNTHGALVDLLLTIPKPLPNYDALVFGCYMRNFGNHKFKYVQWSKWYVPTLNGRNIKVPAQGAGRVLELIIGFMSPGIRRKIRNWLGFMLKN